MNRNVVIAGVGGQGVKTAMQLIGTAARIKNYRFFSVLDGGLAQRGSCVNALLRLGDDTDGPGFKKGEVDLIVAFEPGEAVRMTEYLRRDGAVVCAMKPVIPFTDGMGTAPYDADAMIDYLKANVDNLVLMDTEEALEKIGSSKVANTLLVGAAARTGNLGLEIDDLKQAVHSLFDEKYWEMNDQALDWNAS